MLLSLPVELVERIVRLALPDEITSTTYGERQATLRACCLVSSGLRAIAQPILEEALWIRGYTEWDKAQEKLSRRPQRLRFLWVGEHWEEKADNFAALLSACTGLRELRLCGWRAFNLCTLKDLTRLRCLVLDDVNLVGVTCPFPSVTELSLSYVLVTAEGRQALLTPTTFPSLRHLTFDMVGSSSTQPAPALISSLVSITVSENAITRDMTAFDHPSTPRLVQVYEDFLDQDVWVDLCKHVEHAQILVDSDQLEYATNVTLSSLTRDLEDRALLPSVRLRLVYLPSDFSSCECSACDACRTIARFRQACTSRGVAIETDDVDEAYGGWRGLRNFEAYAEAKKREREEGQAAAEGGPAE
ncbi:hypothetical protein JCM10213_005258 [Rhodosporidiobolus nylandii]